MEEEIPKNKKEENKEDDLKEVNMESKPEITLPPILIKRETKGDETNSIYIETDKLKLMCTIKGPYYSNARSTDEEDMEISVNITVPEYNTDEELDFEKASKQMEIILAKHFLINKYPRTQLDISIAVYEFKCNFIPYSYMAVSLCASDAGIEQKGLLSCCEISADESGNIKLMEGNTLLEEHKDLTTFIIGCNISQNDMFLFQQHGHCNKDVLKKAIATSMKICEAYNEFLINKV
ncbi:MAG: hypothetical protein MJ252_04545 [archaeon]|nr:hypothetical protein [archaeon]